MQYIWEILKLKNYDMTVFKHTLSIARHRDNSLEPDAFSSMIDARLTESWQQQHWTNVIFGQLLAQFGLRLMLHFHCILSVSCSWVLSLKILTRENFAKKSLKMAFRQILTRSIHTTRAMQMSGGAHGEESKWFLVQWIITIVYPPDILPIAL